MSCVVRDWMRVTQFWTDSGLSAFSLQIGSSPVFNWMMEVLGVTTNETYTEESSRVLCLWTLCRLVCRLVLKIGFVENRERLL